MDGPTMPPTELLEGQPLQQQILAYRNAIAAQLEHLQGMLNLNTPQWSRLLPGFPRAQKSSNPPPFGSTTISEHSQTPQTPRGGFNFADGFVPAWLPLFANYGATPAGPNASHQHDHPPSYSEACEGREGELIPNVDVEIENSDEKLATVETTSGSVSSETSSTDDVAKLTLRINTSKSEMTEQEREKLRRARDRVVSKGRRDWHLYLFWVSCKISFFSVWRVSCTNMLTYFDRDRCPSLRSLSTSNSSRSFKPISVLVARWLPWQTRILAQLRFNHSIDQPFSAAVIFFAEYRATVLFSFVVFVATVSFLDLPSFVLLDPGLCAFRDSR